MSLDAILEVAIGLVFAWLVLSAAASQLQEYVNNVLHLRSVYLEKGIKNILEDPKLVNQFFQHPAIQALCERDPKTGKVKKPSYIPAAKFAQAALDVLVSSGQMIPAADIPAEQMGAQLTANASSPKLFDHIFPSLGGKWVATQNTIAYARTNLEQQFDASMDRVSGWYKRYQQLLSLLIGLGLALALNIDTVQIATQLWTQPTQRQMLVAQMQNGTASSGQDATKLYQQAQDFNLPIGWPTLETNCSQVGFLPGQPTYPGFGGTSACRRILNLPAMNDPWGWLAKILGILVSAVAAGQGAPFWFNAMGKLIGLRGSGPVPAPSQAAAPLPPLPMPTVAPAPVVAPQPEPEQPQVQPQAPQLGEATP